MDTLKFINDYIGTVNQAIGSGAFGEVWLLNDGSVVKITSDKRERECVPILFETQEMYPNRYKEYFPIIYSYGDVTRKLNFVSDVQWYQREPIFWYQREHLMDLQLSKFSYDDWEARLVIRGEIEYIEELVFREFGITMVDTSIHNFGARESNPLVPIFRDLNCRTKKKR